MLKDLGWLVFGVFRGGCLGGLGCKGSRFLQTNKKLRKDCCPVGRVYGGACMLGRGGVLGYTVSSRRASTGNRCIRLEIKHT